MMNDKQNLEFMNHPDLVAAQRRLADAKRRVRSVYYAKRIYKKDGL